MLHVRLKESSSLFTLYLHKGLDEKKESPSLTGLIFGLPMAFYTKTTNFL